VRCAKRDAERRAARERRTQYRDTNHPPGLHVVLPLELVETTAPLSYEGSVLSHFHARRSQGGAFGYPRMILSSRKRSDHMAERTVLVAELKRALRERGLTYVAVARALSLSLATMKRLFARGDFSLQRFETVCELAGVTLRELLERAEEH